MSEENKFIPFSVERLPFYLAEMKESDLIIKLVKENIKKGEQLQQAKKENEKLEILSNTQANFLKDLIEQNKQMRENINNIKNLCNEDWEDMTVDKFQNQLLQALKGVE